MALLGKGLLAIWNGITDAGEREFVKWHIREHIPERVGLTGFLRGRRYVAHDGHPKYFNFYETETAQTLESPQYRARLNAPTQWTQDVVKEFRDTSRTICEVVASTGLGEGAWIEAIQIANVKDRAAFAHGVTQALMPDLAAQDGIVGVHFVRGVDGAAPAQTAESRLRGQPDAKCEWLLLIEAAESSFLQALRDETCANESIRKLAPGAMVERGIYRLQYALSHEEVGRTD
jgi:hypothetical protein